MASDVRRVILAAARAAVDEASAPPPKKVTKHRIPAKRVLLVGAGLLTVTRMARGGRARELFGSFQDRIGDIEQRLRGDDQEGDEDDLAPDPALDDEEDCGDDGGQNPDGEDEEDRDG